MIGNDQPTKTKYKLNLGTWFVRILAVAIGAAIATGVMAYLWLQTDNVRLLEEKTVLEVQLQQLQQQAEILGAESELLNSVSSR